MTAIEKYVTVALGTVFLTYTYKYKYKQTWDKTRQHIHSDINIHTIDTIIVVKVIFLIYISQLQQ